MAKAKKVEKTNNKNLITIVLLIVAGIVILSYSNSTGTGFVTKSTKGVTSMEVSPTKLVRGGYINVHVLPGGKGYSNPLEIYKVKTTNMGTDKKVSDFKVQYCGSICKKEGRASYKMSTSYGKGSYYVKTLDKNTGNVIKVYFDVV